MEQLVILVFIVGFFYLFMIAPQRRKMKAHQRLLKSLQVGDEVVTNAGIFGAVAEVEESVIWIEVAPDVELKIQKSAITQVVTQTDNEAQESANSDDDADASG